MSPDSNTLSLQALAAAVLLSLAHGSVLRAHSGCPFTTWYRAAENDGTPSPTVGMGTRGDVYKIELTIDPNGHAWFDLGALDPRRCLRVACPARLLDHEDAWIHPH
ncbi:hypothetical protein GGS23DRAFT_596419 [Durotheca rogersii]|uniref:uncharacterized protein n=1 Tax=Durotheca rogersii TaxID=419775 RepID=UPI002220F4B7|nr:uncharacterized protein GGS23DRAFT_596419 [Durotheca rogersii]KAI5863933.1 hypothetical protein GGS23DRAFT_596419 [Durotheca rogersii]